MVDIMSEIESEKPNANQISVVFRTSPNMKENGNARIDRIIPEYIISL